MTPGQLVKAVAIALDVPEETVVQHDRNLAVAGLRTMGARGRNAPNVTFLDAGRLLIATLASVRVKDSAGIVRVFEKLLPRPTDELLLAPGIAEGKREPRFSDRAIDVLPENHNFIDALAAVIAEASVPVDIDQLKRRFGAMKIECGMPIAFGHISREGEAGQFYVFTLSAADRAPAKVAKVRASIERGEMDHDAFLQGHGIHQRRFIYGSAIILLGIAFRNGGLPFASTTDALHALLGVEKLSAKRRREASE